MSKDKPLLGKKIDTWLRKEVFMLDYEGENEDLRSEEEKEREREEYRRWMNEAEFYKGKIYGKTELERIKKKERDDWKRKKMKDGASDQSFSEYTEEKEKWKMRKSTFLTLGVILGFVFLMSLCDSGRDRSYDSPDERIPVPRARR